VVGVLLLLGASPVLLLLFPAFSKQQGAFTFLRQINEKGMLAILILIAAFCTGVAGNRLIDDSLDALDLEGEEYSKADYLALRKPDQPQSIKLAEFQAARDSDYTRAWLERHKLFMRVLRGTFSACLLFLIGMVVYRVAQWKWPESVKSRYGVGHFVAALFLMAFFLAAYISESTHYYRRVCELTTGVPKCASR
jgi:uncharacterized membrane protein YiaA